MQKKLEKIFKIENAGTPKAKKVSAKAVFITLSVLKEPYPNNEVIISSDAKTSATAAGTYKNKKSSRDLFCGLVNVLKLFFLKNNFVIVTIAPNIIQLANIDGVFINDCILPISQT